MDTGTVTELQYDGKTGQVYKIWILEILLSILTVGIYHFWGKTRVRRYLTSSFTLGGDRFEYTGTGGELFWGYIKAIFFLIVLCIPFFYSVYHLQKITQEMKSEQAAQTDVQTNNQTESEETRLDSSGHQEEALATTEHEIELSEADLAELTHKSLWAVVVYLVYIVFFISFLPYLAKYAALRYRASRLQWRGIRGHLDNASISYAFLGFFHLCLTLITLTLWKPFADLMLHKFKCNRLYFGDKVSQYQPPYLKLFLYYLKVLAIAAVGVVLMVIQPDLALISIPLFIIAFFMYLFGYRAAFNRAKYNTLRFGPIGFICDMTAWQLFKFHLVNGLILLCTIGLGYPIVLQRRQRFLKEHIKITGDFNSAEILQAAGKKDKTGEGLLALFDLKVSLY